MRFYCSAKISNKLSKTPEGFLVCHDVAIARTGEQLYLPSEVKGVTRGGNSYITVERDDADVFNSETMASFEGKPVTLLHPKDFVTAENWKSLAVGTVHNVRRGTGELAGKLVTDLIVADSEAIKKIESRELREVSCGYDTEYVEVTPGRARQTKIRGNHLALVPRGRAGPECAIFDSAPEGITMTAKDKLIAFFTKAIDAMPSEEDGDESKDGTPAFLKKKLDKAEEDTKQADKKAKDAQVALDAANTALAALKTSSMVADAALTALKAEVEALKSPGTKANDAAVVAVAEILAPGIAKDCKDIQSTALKTAYATTDGKTVIDKLTGGKAPVYDNADVVNLLFSAAASQLADVRKAALAGKGTPASAKDAKVVDFHADFNAAAAKLHAVPKF
jgi:uncharacterized protein